MAETAEDVAAYFRLLNRVRIKAKLALALYLLSLIALVPRAHHATHHRLTGPLLAILTLNAIYCVLVNSLNRYLILRGYLREQTRRENPAKTPFSLDRDIARCQTWVKVATRLWPVALALYVATLAIYVFEWSAG